MVNLGGLPSPTHHFAGLGIGNVKSLDSSGKVSSPRRAARQALELMVSLSNLGVPHILVPPHFRPVEQTLRELGFKGRFASILEQAFEEEPKSFSSLFSSSTMWVANAATATAAPDSCDRRVHLTTANLCSTFHRGMESDFTHRFLTRAFETVSGISLHQRLPPCRGFCDEGGANHIRFYRAINRPGVNLFVYGRPLLAVGTPITRNYTPRHDEGAARAIRRLHNLPAASTIFAQQRIEAIDAGVFHNDVICMGFEDTIILHRMSFENQREVLESLSHSFKSTCGSDLKIIEISDHEMSLSKARDCYLFNSQIVRATNGSVVMIAPEQCRNSRQATNVINRLMLGPKPVVDDVIYIDLAESMSGGGGPACLRLRLFLKKHQLLQFQPGLILDSRLQDVLLDFVEKHYPDDLRLDDLKDRATVRHFEHMVLVLHRLLSLSC